ncbi:MAG: ABC transporter permease [Chromatiales bacterium]
MIDVALRSLVFDRSKLVGSLAGVALATTLLLVEIGLYVGLLDSSAALVRHVGGDVWLMARGTEVLDNADLLPAHSEVALKTHPCTVAVRALIVVTLPIKKRNGAIDYVQVVGGDSSGPSPLPWALVRGAPADLQAPFAVAIDEHDLPKLQIAGDPLGATLRVHGTDVRVAALTRGVRAFSLNPYVFTGLDNARRIVGARQNEAHYFVAHAKDARCADALSAAFRSGPGVAPVEVHRTRDFAAMTERYWVHGSGAGGALAFSAVFSLAVGAVIVGQTLYSTVKEHMRELATLRAMGGTRRELLSFIGWQSSTLAAAGGVVGALLGFMLRALLSRGGIAVALTGDVLALGAVAVTVMCALATLPSAIRVLRVSPGEVLR